MEQQVLRVFALIEDRSLQRLLVQLEAQQCQGLNKPWPASVQRSSLRWKSTRFRTFFFAICQQFLQHNKSWPRAKFGSSVALSTLALCLSGIKMTLGCYSKNCFWDSMDKWHLFFPIYEVAMSITVQEVLVVPNVNWDHQFLLIQDKFPASALWGHHHKYWWICAKSHRCQSVHSCQFLRAFEALSQQQRWNLT